MWICFIYTIKERCKLCGYVLYIQLREGVSCVDMFYRKGVSCVDMFYIYKLCGYVLRKGVSCVDMFYIYN